MSAQLMTRLIEEARHAASIERNTGRPATSVDAPSLFELANEARQAAGVLQPGVTRRITYGGERFSVTANLAVDGRAESLTVRTLRGAVVLVADTKGLVLRRRLDGKHSR